MAIDDNVIRIDSDSIEVLPAIQRLPEFLQFAQWFATPRQFRELKNQKQFADAVGVCEDTLTDWKRHPEFWPLVKQHMNKWMWEQIPAVIGALCKKAINKGGAKEVDMFLRLAGMETNKNKKDKNAPIN